MLLNTEWHMSSCYYLATKKLVKEEIDGVTAASILFEGWTDKYR